MERSTSYFQVDVLTLMQVRLRGCLHRLHGPQVLTSKPHTVCMKRQNQYPENTQQSKIYVRTLRYFSGCRYLKKCDVSPATKCVLVSSSFAKVMMRTSSNLTNEGSMRKRQSTYRRRISIVIALMRAPGWVILHFTSGRVSLSAIAICSEHSLAKS